MKKTILTLALTTIGAGANADWIKFTDTEDGSVYFDPSTIRRSDDYVVMWQMQNLKKPQPIDKTTFLSFKDRTEYDCANERSRTSSVTFYSKRMGLGMPVGSMNDSTADSWKDVVPGTSGETLLRIACDKFGAFTRQFNWIFVEDIGELRFYVDATPHKSNSLPISIMWTLLDFKKQGKGQSFASGRVLWFFDCSEKMEATAIKVLYSKPMGTGDVFSFNTVRAIDWRKVDSGSLGERTLKIACRE
jgi:hypothetical protein